MQNVRQVGSSLSQCAPITSDAMNSYVTYAHLRSQRKRVFVGIATFFTIYNNYYVCFSYIYKCGVSRGVFIWRVCSKTCKVVVA